MEHLNQGNFASVDMRKFNEFEIPVVPIEIQHEIAKILDNFTLLRQELLQELDLRDKQYTFYRDQILSFLRKE